MDTQVTQPLVMRRVVLVAATPVLAVARPVNPAASDTEVTWRLS